MNIPLVSRALPPPLVMKVPLLLAEFCPARILASQNNLAPQLFSGHAIKITAALRQFIYPTAWRHGGLNE